MSFAFRCIVLAPLLYLQVLTASASQLNAIISQYSAAEFASATAIFKQRFPDRPISARTPEQLAELDDAAIAEWLSGASTLLAVGVFGSEVERLRPLIEQHSRGERFILHSDQALVGMSRSAGRDVFSNRDQAVRLGAEKPGDDLAAWVRELGAENPDQADWIEARSYWLAGGSENIARMLAWLTERDNPGRPAAPPQARAAMRFYQDGQVRTAEDLVWRGERMVAVIDHGRADRRGDADLNDALCQTLQQRDIACISLFANWGEGTLQALRWL